LQFSFVEVKYTFKVKNVIFINIIESGIIVNLVLNMLFAWLLALSYGVVWNKENVVLINKNIKRDT